MCLFYSLLKHYKKLQKIKKNRMAEDSINFNKILGEWKDIQELQLHASKGIIV